MDYLEWRGDLTFNDSSVNEVDNLIFCLLSYVDLDGIVPNNPSKGKVSLRQAAMEYFFTHVDQKERALGFMIPDDILVLFRRMACTKRYGDLQLTGYINEISEERKMQFSALTIYLPKEQMFVAFRGTDDTIVGWHEDYNMSHLEEVPAQRKATEYLNGLDITPDTGLYVGGHSKGGNLAVWGAVHATQHIQDRIVGVYSNDGPGFSEGTVQSEAYRNLSKRISILLPNDSLVGLLLEHDARYAIVKSNRKGLFQHDGLSWEVLGGHFIRVDALSSKGIHNDTVIRERIQAMTGEERRFLIEIIFFLLESTGAKTLSELYTHRRKVIMTMIKTFRNLPPESQKIAAFLWEKLVGGKIESGKIEKEQNYMIKKENPTRKHGSVRISFFPLLLP
jgi:hypothetical protein